jgi:hypothetical protein
VNARLHKRILSHFCVFTNPYPIRCRVKHPLAALIMAELSEEQLQELKKKRTFRKYAYRGVDLDQLLDMSQVRSCVSVQSRARVFRSKS